MAQHFSTRDNPHFLDEYTMNIDHNLSTKNLQSDETNLMVECFANTEKLVDSEERVYFNKDNENDNDNVDQLDDDVNKYVDNTPKTVFQPKATHSEKSNNSHHNNSADSSYQQNSATATETEKKIDPNDESLWTKEELLTNKLKMMRNLGELLKSGVTLSQNYGMNSSYKEMKFEYDLHTGIKHKKNAVEFMSSMMFSIIKGVELLNDSCNPFDMKFDGVWSNKVSSDITNYYDVLGKIYEKYTKDGKPMAPELELFLMLSGSAINIQMHKGLANLLPSTAQTLDDDPNVLRDLRNKANLDKQNLSKPTYSQQQQTIIKQKTDAEHENANNMLADMQWIKKSEEDYAKMKQQAEEQSVMNNFKNNLVMSDTIGSNMSNNKNLANTLMQENAIKKQFETQQKKQDLIMQQQKLANVNNMLKNMKLPEQEHKNSTKISQINKTTKQNYNKLKSNTDSDDLSLVSTVSSMSVNPKKNEILGKGNKKKISLIKMVDNNNNTQYETISTGNKSKRSKKSDDSDSNESKGPRRKGINIKIGK